MTPAVRMWLAYRLVHAATFVALTWKFRYFVWASRVYFDMPLDLRLFPAPFEAPETFLGAYAAAVLASGFGIVAPSARLAQTSSGLALLALSILCLHLGSYNDATFTTAWWVMLWATWFAGRIAIGDVNALSRGARLSGAIVSLVFLGGAVGKWTPEYWSGQVLYEIYFVDRNFWLFNYLRNALDGDALRTVATAYSRFVISVESICGLMLWLLPPRLAAVCGVAVFLGIAALSNYLLFSVVLSVMGLAAVGLFVDAGAAFPHSAGGRRA